MAHQYMPKIFHGPHKNPVVLPPTYLMYGTVILERKMTPCDHRRAPLNNF